MLCWWVVEKFKNFTFVVNLASGFQTEVAVVYIFKFIKHLTNNSDNKHKLILIDIRLYNLKLKYLKKNHHKISKYVIYNEL